MSYQNQVCIITGASGGLGAVFARELDKRGAKLVLFARRAENLNTLAATLDGDHIIVVGDVTQADDRAKLVDAALKVFGRIDVLINNAGVSGGGKLLSLDEASIERVIQTNLSAAVHLTRVVVPHMIERKQGLIINLSSPLGHIAVPNGTLYNVSKAGLSMFSASLRRNLSHHNIHTMDLQPGFTRSEIVTPEVEKNLPAFIPVKDPEPVIIGALHAALHRRAEYATGGNLVRLGIWINRNFPSVVDWAFARYRK
jgi:short-subunit dehydrogenase